MNRDKKLILKSLVVIALGFVWLGTKPRAALAMGGGYCGCESTCPGDITLYCFEQCGTDMGGSCGVAIGCVGIAITCNTIY